VLGVLLAACQQAGTRPASSPSARPTSSPLAACPLGPPAPAQQVLLSNRPAPDDLAFDNQGRLLFSDINAGSVFALNGDGSVQTIAGGLSEPEGIVVQADGRMLVAEQGRNRISAIDPQTHAVSVWRTFPNRTANTGIDGIGPILPAKDSNGQPLPNGDDVVVPDSPNGVVWLVSPDGKAATQLASGMTRPVGAARDSNGRILVADEGGALWRLDPAKHRLTTLPTPDDVAVTQDGHLFVNTLGDNAIHELDPEGRQIQVLTGIAQPQGIALDGADNLYVAAMTGGRIERLVRSFTLDAPKVTRVAGNTFSICLAIRRAPGYTQPLGLSIGSSSKASILQLVQPGTDSSGALEVQTSERSLIIVVSQVTGSSAIELSQTIALSP
jgi:sugar lactone lactonase YvrE